MNSLLIYPIRLAAIGPLNGMSDIVSAAETPLSANMSSNVSLSLDKEVTIICTSFLKSFGKSGLIGLSINRSMRTACVVGRPSRLKKLPGMLPME